MTCRPNGRPSMKEEWTSVPSDTQNSFKTQTTWEGRILVMLKHLAAYPLQNPEWEICNEAVKSAIESRNMRNSGNKIYKGEHLDSSKCLAALKLYSASILLAPEHSEEIAIAHANKSAVLYVLGKYEDSIRDITKALKLNYPERLDKKKLYQRAMVCLEKLYPKKITRKEAIEKLEELRVPETMMNEWKIKHIEIDDPPKLEKVIEIEDEFPIPKIQLTNNQLPGASNALEIKQDRHYGRYLVSTRNIQPGQALLVEKVYSSLVDLHSLFGTCYRCLKSSFANVPCKLCNFAMYCSEECRTKDWEMSHDVECQIFRIFPLDESKSLLEVTRLIVRTIRNFSSLDKFMHALNRKDDEDFSQELTEEEKLHIKNYQMLDSLETHISKITTPLLWSRARVICWLLQAIAKHTSIFGRPIKKIATILKNDNILFFGGLLLKFTFTISINTYTINGWASTCTEAGSLGIASGISPVFSLCAHNCDPNVAVFCRSDTLVMHAIYPIQKGDMVTTCYCLPYYNTPKMERSLDLLKYFFLCNCTACKKDWALYINSSPQVLSVKREKIQRKIKLAIKKCLTEGQTMRPTTLAFQHLFHTMLLIHDYLPRNSFEIITTSVMLRGYYIQLGNRCDAIMVNRVQT